MSDIVERLRDLRFYGYPVSLAGEAADCVTVLRERLATARAEAADDAEAAYTRGYADATKSIAAVTVRDHG